MAVGRDANQLIPGQVCQQLPTWLLQPRMWRKGGSRDPTGTPFTGPITPLNLGLEAMLCVKVVRPT